jgi:hypothetical protein
MIFFCEIKSHYKLPYYQINMVRQAIMNEPQQIANKLNLSGAQDLQSNAIE